MKLFLTSSTITSNLVKPFERLIGKDIHGLKCAFITDAMFAPSSNLTELIAKQYLEDDTNLLINDYKWDLDMIRLEEKVPEDFSKYDVIYVNGGLPSYLTKVIRETGFDKILADLIAKDIPYVGSSAGSMVMSDVQDAAEWYIGEEDPEVKDMPGLGYVNFQIYPHFEENVLPEILKHKKEGLDYYLLRNGEAIAVTNQYLQLLGKGIFKL